MDKRIIHKRLRRRARIRYRLKKNRLLRLSVHRSHCHIYAQIIDDAQGKTLTHASSLDKELKLKSGGNIEAAHKVGELLGTRAQKANIKKVVFDRGFYQYHGRIKALAESARKAGLEF